MAKKKNAEISTDLLVPFGYVEGTDLTEFLTSFGYNSENETIAEFCEKTWGIK